MIVRDRPIPLSIFELLHRALFSVRNGTLKLRKTPHDGRTCLKSPTLSPSASPTTPSAPLRFPRRSPRHSNMGTKHDIRHQHIAPPFDQGGDPFQPRVLGRSDPGPD